MTNYKASEKLIDIFKRNGFREVTEEKYPDHYKRLMHSGYDPKTMKRILTIDGKNYVKFDYLSILPIFNGGTDGPEIKDELTIDEIKSIVTFFKLPHQTRKALKRHHQNVLNLHERYSGIKRYPQFYKDKGSRLLAELFESVSIFE